MTTRLLSALMLKRIVASLALPLALLVLETCASKKPEYLNPTIVYDRATGRPPEEQAEVDSLLEVGKLIFRDKCSGCHGIFTAGQDNIPNFTSKQLDSYEAAFVMQDPKIHEVSRTISPADLNTVLLFLRYRIPTAPEQEK